MSDLSTLQDYIAAFFTFLGQLFMTQDMLWNVTLSAFTATMTYIILWVFSAQLFPSLQLKLLATRFARLAPRIHEISFLVLFTSLLWILIPIVYAFKIQTIILEILRNLATAVLVIRLALLMLPNRFLLIFIIVFAGAVAILEILGVLHTTMVFLDHLFIRLGEVQISILKLINSTLVITISYFVLALVKDQVDQLVKNSPNLNPAQKVLTQKFVTIGVIILLVLIGLAALGISITAIAVFTGAIGLGVGIGLQKIFLNLLSGFIILFDRSIKPGDVITVGTTFGWVNSIHARYISVITRDGKEHLIPNEKFISEPVENWTYSSSAVRMRVPIPVADDTDIEKAAHILLQVAKRHPRIIDKPEPRALIIGIGDSSVNFELRVWIQDPAKGLTNVRSDLLFEILKKFKKHKVLLPSPQRKILITREEAELE